MADVEGFESLSPSALEGFIGKFVKVYLTDNSEKRGVIYSIDPVTCSVIIVEISADNVPGLAHFVSGHAIRRVHVEEEERKTEEIIKRLNKIFDKKSEIMYTEDELRERKKGLQEWLEKNHVPVTEQDDALSVMEILFIDPPYDRDSCRSTNEMVLARVQKLISSKPAGS